MVCRFELSIFQLAYHQIKEKKIQEAMHSLQQAGAILHTGRDTTYFQSNDSFIESGDHGQQ